MMLNQALINKKRQSEPKETFSKPSIILQYSREETIYWKFNK